MQELGLTARFAAALAAVPDDIRVGPIGLAVSGGSDSIALLHLAHDWARARGAALAVFTVDHKLRPAAAAEAEAVGAVCQGLGLSHRTLVWAAPVLRQSAARRGRHALLAGALKAAGGRLLLTGHTASDQAETFLMRARQGSGWYGLAGMRRLSLSPVWPEGDGIWIARPLLGEARPDLRGWLEGQGAAWSEDPSNDDPAFERVRVRARLSADPGLADRIAACQCHFSRLRALEDALLARWMDDEVAPFLAPGLRARFDGLSPDRAARALGILIQCVSGRETPARSESLANLTIRLLDPANFKGATLAGVRVRKTGDRMYLTDEVGRAGDRQTATQIASRLAAFRRLFLNSAKETESRSGKESFLKALVPIFTGETVSSDRDDP